MFERVTARMSARCRRTSGFDRTSPRHSPEVLAGARWARVGCANCDRSTCSPDRPSFDVRVLHAAHRRAVRFHPIGASLVSRWPFLINRPRGLRELGAGSACPFGRGSACALRHQRHHGVPPCRHDDQRSRSGRGISYVDAAPSSRSRRPGFRRCISR